MYERNEIDSEIGGTMQKIIEIGRKEAKEVYSVEHRELTATIYIVVTGPFEDLRTGLIVRRVGNEYTVAPGMISNDMEFWTTDDVESVYTDTNKAVADVQNRLTN